MPRPYINPYARRRAPRSSVPEMQLPGYYPVDPGIIQQSLAQKQQRYDATNAAKAQAFAALNEQMTLSEDTPRKQEILQHLRDKYYDVNSEYSGDLAAAAGDVTQFIGNMRKDPFWKLNEYKVQKAEEADKIRQQLQAQGQQVVEFSPAAQIYNPETGQYASTEELKVEQAAMTDDEAIATDLLKNIQARIRSTVGPMSVGDLKLLSQGRIKDITDPRIRKIAKESVEPFKEKAPQYLQRWALQEDLWERGMSSKEAEQALVEKYSQDKVDKNIEDFIFASNADRIFEQRTNSYQQLETSDEGGGGRDPLNPANIIFSPLEGTMSVNSQEATSYRESLEEGDKTEWGEIVSTIGDFFTGGMYSAAEDRMNEAAVQLYEKAHKSPENKEKVIKALDKIISDNNASSVARIANSVGLGSLFNLKPFANLKIQSAQQIKNDIQNNQLPSNLLKEKLNMAVLGIITPGGVGQLSYAQELQRGTNKDKANEEVKALMKEYGIPLDDMSIIEAATMFDTFSAKLSSAAHEPYTIKPGETEAQEAVADSFKSLTNLMGNADADIRVHRKSEGESWEQLEPGDNVKKTFLNSFGDLSEESTIAKLANNNQISFILHGDSPMEFILSADDGTSYRISGDKRANNISTVYNNATKAMNTRVDVQNNGTTQIIQDSQGREVRLISPVNRKGELAETAVELFNRQPVIYGVDTQYNSDNKNLQKIIHRYIPDNQGNLKSLPKPITLQELKILTLNKLGSHYKPNKPKD